MREQYSMYASYSSRLLCSLLRDYQVGYIMHCRHTIFCLKLHFLEGSLSYTVSIQLCTGVDLHCQDALKALVAQHQVPSRRQAVMHVLSLENPIQLRPYDR